MNKTDFEQLTDMRIGEAKVLLDAGMSDGSYYLAGYAVECALKACIASLTNQYDYPDKKFSQDCYTHDIEKLVTLAGIKHERDSDTAISPDLETNWQLVKDWSELARYERKSITDAQNLYDAITHQAHGVLVWIKAHW